MQRSDLSGGPEDSAAEHLYTTPPNTWAPLYGPAPHTFSSLTSVQIIARAPPGVLKTLVAYPLECNTDLFSVVWGRCDTHGHNENHVYRQWHLIDFTIPTSYRGVKGFHSTLEYTDFSQGQCVGRELFGYCKKRGAFDWKETPDGFEFKCFAEDGSVLAESVISLRPKDASNVPEWPAELNDYKDGPTLQVLVSRKLGTYTAVRADVLRIDSAVPSDGKSYPNASFRSATGTLTLHDGPLDPLKKLGPVAVIAVRVDTDVSFDFGPGVAIGSAKLPAE